MVNRGIVRVIFATLPWVMKKEKTDDTIIVS